MHRLFGVLVLALAATALARQGEVRIHTNPKVPARAVLERLDLRMAWSTKVPVDGLRDGFYSLQLVPGKSFTLLVAQTLKGSVIAINADTGDTLWRTTVGLPYRSQLPVACNDRTIFVRRQLTIFALDRQDGKQLLYTVDPDSNLPEYGARLTSAPTALAADDRWLFVSFGDLAVRYGVPNFRLTSKLSPEAAAGAKLQASPQLIRLWDFASPGFLSQPPVLTPTAVVLTADDGSVVVLRKSAPAGDDPEVLWQFKTEGAVAAAVASHKSMIYIPSQDFFLYAFDTLTGKLRWRFPGQAPLNSPPAATDADVFVTVSKGGLHRLDRANGKTMWSNNDTTRFLATNQRFVYALDRVGNMQVLDYDRGKALAAWDAREWNLQVPNELTDRIYLASHDGQILCLHHRDQVKPMTLKTFDEILPKAKDLKKKDADVPPVGGGDGKGPG